MERTVAAGSGFRDRRIQSYGCRRTRNEASSGQVRHDAFLCAVDARTLVSIIRVWLQESMVRSVIGRTAPGAQPPGR
jgi:hypothetical protein